MVEHTNTAEVTYEEALAAFSRALAREEKENMQLRKKLRQAEQRLDDIDPTWRGR